jgi:hypothetical protein
MLRESNEPWAWFSNDCTGVQILMTKYSLVRVKKVDWLVRTYTDISRCLSLDELLLCVRMYPRVQLLPSFDDQ